MASALQAAPHQPPAPPRVFSLPRLALFLGLYTLLALLLAKSTGHLSFLGDKRLFFATYDSREYKGIADFLVTLGKAPRPHESVFAMRPFLFPLYLATYRVIGVAPLQMLQVLFNGVSLCLLYSAICNVLHSKTAATLAVALLCTFPSFHFLAFHALTESLAILLLTSVIYSFSFIPYRESATYQGVGTFILAGAIYVKPSLLPVAGLLVPAILATLRHRARNTLAIVIIASSLLLGLQLTYSWTLAGSPRLSSSAYQAIAYYFYPTVRGFLVHGESFNYRSPVRERVREAKPRLSHMLGYLWDHPSATYSAYKVLLLRENLFAVSIYVKPPQSVAVTKFKTHLFLTTVSRYGNAVTASLHILSIPVALFFFVRVPVGGHLKLLVGGLYLGAGFVILASGLVYGQGDRLVLSTAPLWISAYLVIFYKTANFFRGPRRGRPCSPTQSAGTMGAPVEGQILS